MGFAIPFPNLNFTQTLSREEQTYLGIPRKRTFSFREIRGSLILIEILSIYCPSCELQAQILNEVYLSIEKDPRLKGKVKMIGIAAGNNPNEVENFKKEYRVPYPIFSDPKFDAHTAVGSPRTPFVIWVRRDAQRKSTVVSTHLGLIDSMKSALDETRAVLQYNLAQLKLQEGPIYACNLLRPPLPDEELQAKAKEAMETSGGRVLEIKKISLKDKDWFYVGKVDFGTYQKNLFAKLASREAICDICHDTYFIYAFDPDGKVVEIVPIQLTKIQNLQWTKEDVERLRSRTVGRSILQSFDFNPQVDSVSGATITAVLVFDCLDKGKEIYEKLRKEGYIMR
jgi:peroxiredoxin